MGVVDVSTVPLALEVGVEVGVADGVDVGDSVGVLVGVLVRVLVGVLVRVLVMVATGLGVAVDVRVGCGVDVDGSDGAVAETGWHAVKRSVPARVTIGSCRRRAGCRYTGYASES